MESATDEFYYQSRIPPQPSPLPAQTLEINGHKYVLNHRFKSIKIGKYGYTSEWLANDLGIHTFC